MQPVPRDLNPSNLRLNRLAQPHAVVGWRSTQSVWDVSDATPQVLSNSRPTRWRQSAGTVGVDLGVLHLASLSDGATIPNPRALANVRTQCRLSQPTGDGRTPALRYGHVERPVLLPVSDWSEDAFRAPFRRGGAGADVEPASPVRPRPAERLTTPRVRRRGVARRCSADVVHATPAAHYAPPCR
jgi:hypothetical protein